MFWKRFSCFSDEGKHLMFGEFHKVEEFSQEERVEAIGEKLSEIEKSLKSENGIIEQQEKFLHTKLSKVEESVTK
jgi:hypothetical protein